MIRLVLVTNPADPSRDQVVEEHLPGGTLRDMLDQHALRQGKHTSFALWTAEHIASVNGHVWPPSVWDLVTPQDGDCIVIVPQVAGGSTGRMLATVGVLVAAVAITVLLGPAGGVLSFALLGATSAALLAGAVSIAGNLLISAFMGPAQPSASTTSASYDPDGPTSLSRSGTVIPKGYGTYQWGGNIVASFVDIAGTDQYINVLVCFGFGPARSISNVYINNKPISEYQDVAYFTRLGTNDQTEIQNFNSIVNGYPQDTQCLAGVPVVVPGTGDLTESLQVDIQFPAGVFVNTADGHIIPAVITYLLEYSVSGANNWQPVIVPQTTSSVTQQFPDGTPYFPGGNQWGVIASDLGNTNVVYAVDSGPHNPGDPWTGTINIEMFDANGNHYMYLKPCAGTWQYMDVSLNYVYVLTWSAGYQDFVAAQTTTCYSRSTILGLAPNKYDVRVTKYGSARLHDDVSFGDNFSPTIGQDMWVHSVNEITYQDLVYPNMILIGVRALATTQLNGQSLKVTALVEHGLRTKDTGLLPAQLAAFEEDNPACVAADMLLDDLYGGGAWPGVQPANIERFIDEWEAWAANNDQLVPDGNGNSIRMCVFNGIMDQESDLWTQSQAVTQMSRACLVPVGRDFSVATDQPVEAPVQMFTVGNILQDSFTENWLQIDERCNQVEVQFADSTRYYKQDNPLVYMDPAQQQAGVIIKNSRLNGRGITIPAQAWHYARYKERSNQFLLRSGTFRTDTDGIACRPFSVIAIQHDVPQWGYGGRLLPGSTTTLLLPDRDDLVYTAGTAYSVMVQHAAVLRATVPVTAFVTSSSPAAITLTVPAWANDYRITRAVIGAYDCAVSSTVVGSITITPATGYVPAVGQTVQLYDTDLMDTQTVTGIDPATGGLQLAAPLLQTPDDYSTYIYGVAGDVKWVRVTKITKASEFRSTIEWVDYDADVYTVAAPIIGETSAQISSNPGVTSLTGSESFQLVSGVYVTYANLAWRNGPDTVGVGIYAQIVGGSGLPQLVARTTGTSYQAQQSPGTTVLYTVVGYDQNNVFAGFSSAPTATIDALGVTANLLFGSSFASGFTYWNISPRAGDAFAPNFTDGSEAVYTVAGTALTAAQELAFQVVQPGKWTVGDYLMLSGYIEDSCLVSTAPNVGQVILGISLQDGTGTITSTTDAATLNGVQPTLTRFNTAAVQIPTGTVAVIVTVSVGGAGLSVPVGSTITLSHFLLEQATTAQTTPSAWADLDTQGSVLNLFTTGSSTLLRTQGSVLPTLTGRIAYLVGSNDATISWTALVLTWPDGSLTEVQDGSIAITGLVANSTYVASLYYDVVLGGVYAAVPSAPLGTPGVLSAALDSLAVSVCSLDNHIPLTPGGLTFATVVSGGSSVSGGGGGTQPACTLRGTTLPTPDGPLSNEEIKLRFDRGEDVYLIGRNSSERVLQAFWSPVDVYYRVEVDGFASFHGSESLPMLPEGGKHTWIRDIPNGTRVDTVDGYRTMHKLRLGYPGEVLYIELAGPSHEYLVVDGVWTHNYKLYQGTGSSS